MEEAVDEGEELDSRTEDDSVGTGLEELGEVVGAGTEELEDRELEELIVSEELEDVAGGGTGAVDVELLVVKDSVLEKDELDDWVVED